MIAKLIKIQDVEGLTDAQMAQKLGIHEKSWNRIKNGKSKGSKQFLQGVIKSYPGLRKEVADYLGEL